MPERETSLSSQKSRYTLEKLRQCKIISQTSSASVLCLVYWRHLSRTGEADRRSKPSVDKGMAVIDRAFREASQAISLVIAFPKTIVCLQMGLCESKRLVLGQATRRGSAEVSPFLASSVQDPTWTHLELTSLRAGDGYSVQQVYPQSWKKTVPPN